MHGEYFYVQVNSYSKNVGFQETVSIWSKGVFTTNQHITLTKKLVKS